jgi:hypothetical protein
MALDVPGTSSNVDARQGTPIGGCIARAAPERAQRAGARIALRCPSRRGKHRLMRVISRGGPGPAAHAVPPRNPGSNGCPPTASGSVSQGPRRNQRVNWIARPPRCRGRPTGRASPARGQVPAGHKRLAMVSWPKPFVRPDRCPGAQGPGMTRDRSGACWKHLFRRNTAVRMAVRPATTPTRPRNKTRRQRRGAPAPDL